MALVIKTGGILKNALLVVEGGWPLFHPGPDELATVVALLHFITPFILLPRPEARTRRFSFHSILRDRLCLVECESLKKIQTHYLPCRRFELTSFLPRANAKAETIKSATFQHGTDIFA